MKKADPGTEREQTGKREKTSPAIRPKREETMTRSQDKYQKKADKAEFKRIKKSGKDETFREIPSSA